MARMYPLGKTVVITILCLLAIAGAYIYTNGLVTSKNNIDEAVAINPQVQSEQKTIETSADWKKQFSGNSKNVSLTSATKNKPTQPQENLTLTDKIGRNFLVSYVQLEQGGLIKDEETIRDAADYAIQNAVQSASQPITYKANNLRSVATTPESVRAYGNDVGTAFATYSPRTDAANVAADAFENENMSLLENIDPIISGYQKTISALLAMPVPSTLTQQHLNLLNGLSGVLYVAQGLRTSDKDPMQAMVALGTYGAALNILQNSLRDIKGYFNENNISFASNEPGSSFATI